MHQLTVLICIRWVRGGLVHRDDLQAGCLGPSRLATRRPEAFFPTGLLCPHTALEGRDSRCVIEDSSLDFALQASYCGCSGRPPLCRLVGSTLSHEGSSLLLIDINIPRKAPSSPLSPPSLQHASSFHVALSLLHHLPLRRLLHR